MLKKWLKKRRSSSSKHAADGGFEASISSDINTTPPRKQKSANRLLSSGKTKKGKGNKSLSRKSSYKNIEKEESRLSYSHPIITPVMRQSATSIRSSSTSSKKDVTTSLRSSPTNSISRLLTATPTPDNGVTTADNTRSKKNGDKNDPKISKMKIIAAIDRHGEKKDRTQAKIKPIQGPRDHPRTSVFNASSTEQHKEAPPPPAAEMMARDMSLLGVASFPSIDTALFGHGDGDDNDDNEDPVGVLYGEVLAPERERDIPPSIIQAILPAEIEVQEPPGDATHVQKNVPPKPLKDEDFLSGTTAQSGTGSKRLQAWISEVQRSIEETRQQNDPNLDRYHVDGDETIVEEKSDKDVGLSEEVDHHEALLESQNKIEQSLRETIQKSKTQMTALPKGILKNKTFESGTVHDEGVTTGTDSSGESSSDPVSSEEETGIKFKRTMAVRPIKVFSKSRRQRLRERSFSTEDEATASIASQSSSGSDIAYETLRQIHPSVSRDDTQKTKESVQVSLFHQICDIGDIMEDYEADLCQMDDAMSITDDTIGSRSTISKDSFAAHTNGWLCFSPY